MDKLALLLEFAVCFYNVGTIWAHEVDIFRSWRLIDTKDFHDIQQEHWRKLPYWIFTPLGLALSGSIVLVWFHPVGSPAWAIGGNLGLLVLSLVLTALFWGKWQARLSKDSAGPQSIYLAMMLKTHWVRTMLINAYAGVLLAWVMKLFGRG